MRVAPTAKMFWQITPWRADAEFPDYRVNEKTIAKIAVACAYRLIATRRSD